MKNQEILIIFLLAILVTGGSWFYAPDSVCGFRADCNRGINPTSLNGFPMAFVESSLYAGSRIDILGLVIDIFFWSLVLGGGWLVIKKLKTKK